LKKGERDVRRSMQHSRDTAGAPLQHTVLHRTLS
jgi:hypothetical protein